MAKKGRQKPTFSKILPYKKDKTRGAEAIEFYERSGRTAQKWQVDMLNHILAINKNDLFVHTKFGYSVPRRNGKNEVVVMREIFGLMTGERILHTAHRTSTTHSAWERLYNILTKADIPIVSTYRAYGKEHIEVASGGKIEFRTRTSKGGLGEGFDLLVIDEAQEYTDDQETALKYVVTDSSNPQTLFCGTPPTMVSSGTIFTKMRDQVIANTTKNTGWAEWGVTEISDPNDKKLWYLTNPSLGYILKERSVMDEIGTDNIDFNIQRLGLWYRYNIKSAISNNDWNSLAVDTVPQFDGKICVGIKFGIDNVNCALSVAIKTTDGRIFVEAIDCLPIRVGFDWLLKFLLKVNYVDVVVDGINGQQALAEEMKKCNLKKPIIPTVREIINANFIFESAIYSKTICHKNQPSLTEIATNTDKRPIGSQGGFGYKSLREDLDIVLLDSVILAHWLCATQKEKPQMKITY